MAKKLFTIVVILFLLFPAINGMNEKKNELQPNSFHSFNSPVALFEYKISNKKCIFNASSSYDVNGGNLQYRWDFDNDGIFDTKWLSSPKIKHAYNKPYNGFVKLQVKNENGEDECIEKIVVGNSGIDQKQEKADDFVKIYGSHYFAQTFKPSMLRLEGLDIYVGK